MEKANVDYKQVKNDWERGEEEGNGVRAQGLLSPTNDPVWQISSSWNGGLEGQSAFISESCERRE